jgi:predicted DNA-binding antitoxin AbrB/MazE fold protein
MARVVDAIYEAGMLKPLETLDLPEHQRVRITIHDPTEESPDAQLAAWQEVYDGLTEEEAGLGRGLYPGEAARAGIRQGVNGPGGGV